MRSHPNDILYRALYLACNRNVDEYVFFLDILIWYPRGYA